MKATVKGRYEGERNSAIATVAVPVGDLRLKASITDATVVKGPSLRGLSLALEKPGSFVIDYNVPKNDVRFVFMNTVSVMEKPVSLTYTHVRGENRTALDGTAVFDPANKVAVSYAFGTGACRIKYSYLHGEFRRVLLEPSYDLSKNAWDFAITRKFEGGDALRATYQTSSKNLGLEWNRDSKINGCFKISASLNLAEQQPLPKLVAESTWNFEM